jgi:ketosteroid isomerase-like protein
MARTTHEILQHHGEALAGGDLEGILADYTEDAVLITPQGSFTGTAGAREAWTGLLGDLPDPKVDVSSVAVEGDAVLMTWTASTARGQVEDGVDTLVMGDDGIRLQTIHYTLHQAQP